MPQGRASWKCYFLKPQSFHSCHNTSQAAPPLQAPEYQASNATENDTKEAFDDGAAWSHHPATAATEASQAAEGAFKDGFCSTPLLAHSTFRKQSCDRSGTRGRNFNNRKARRRTKIKNLRPVACQDQQDLHTFSSPGQIFKHVLTSQLHLLQKQRGGWFYTKDHLTKKLNVKSRPGSRWQPHGQWPADLDDAAFQ